jgi:hypothetical protein
MNALQVLEADWTWTGTQFESGMQVVVATWTIYWRPFFSLRTTE